MARLNKIMSKSREKDKPELSRAGCALPRSTPGFFPLSVTFVCTPALRLPSRLSESTSVSAYYLILPDTITTFKIRTLSSNSWLIPLGLIDVVYREETGEMMGVRVLWEVFVITLLSTV